MEPSFHAAWTDAILSVTALGAGMWAFRRDRGQWLLPFGLAVVAAAAAVGTLRLGGVDALRPLHEMVARIAGLVGVPLAGIGVIGHHLSEKRRKGLQTAAISLGLPLGAFALFGPEELVRGVRDVSSGLALLATMGFSAWKFNPMGVAAPVFILVAGLGIAGDGDWLGFPRDGWFHLVMAFAMACFGAAGRWAHPPQDGLE